MLWATVGGALATAVAAIIAATAYLSPPDATLPVASAGSLKFSNEHAYFYPESGTLPSTAPPGYPETESGGHCAEWEAWAQQVGAAPAASPILYVDAVAGRTSPITILKTDFRVFKKTALAGTARIQCQYGAGGAVGSTIFVNLDSNSDRVPMDVDGDSEPDSTLPGGHYVVDPATAETLTAMLEGQPGYVYEYGVTLEIVENGQRRTEQQGTAENPMRIAFEDSNFDSSVNGFDWSFREQRWMPATGCQSAPDQC